MAAWSWVADAVLVLLLTGTMAMAFRLDRALRVVRRDRTAFEALITNMGSATHAVKLGIDALRSEADRAAEQIERRSEEADKIATDLSFLIEAADRSGTKLEQQMKAIAAHAAAPPVRKRSLRIAGHFVRRRRIKAPDLPAPGRADAGLAEPEPPVAVSPIAEASVPELPMVLAVMLALPVAEAVPVEAVAAVPVVAADPVPADPAMADPMLTDPVLAAYSAGLHALAGITTRRNATRVQPGKAPDAAAPPAEAAALPGAATVPGVATVPGAATVPGVAALPAEAASIKLAG